MAARTAFLLATAAMLLATASAAQVTWTARSFEFHCADDCSMEACSMCEMACHQESMWPAELGNCPEEAQSQMSVDHMDEFILNNCKCMADHTRRSLIVELGHGPGVAPSLAPDTAPAPV